MDVQIIETGERHEMTLIDPRTRCDWLNDLMGNHNELPEYNDEVGAHMMTQESYEWWNALVNEYQAADERLWSLREDAIHNRPDFYKELFDEKLLKHNESAPNDLEDLPGHIQEFCDWWEEHEKLGDIANNLRLDSIDLNDAPGGYIATFTLANQEGETCANIELRPKELLGGEVGDRVFKWSNQPEEDLQRPDIAKALEEHFAATSITNRLGLPENYIDIMNYGHMTTLEDHMSEPLSPVEQLQDGYGVRGDLAPGHYVDGEDAWIFYEAYLDDERFIQARNDNESVELFAREDGGGAFAAYWTRGDDGHLHVQSVTAIPEEEAVKLQAPKKGTIPEAWREAGIQEPEKESENER